MKIKYKVGNLMEAEEPIIAHGCNAQGVMGSGVAAAIKKFYPEAFTEYRYQHEQYGLMLGDVIWVRCGQKIILNCITQDFYGRKEGTRYADYDAIRKCFKHINFMNTHDDEKYDSIALPLIGAGLGGGDWSVIAPIIEEECVTIQPVVYVLEMSALPVDFRHLLP